MLIDWKMVDELHSEIGTDEFAEVVMLFLTEVEEVLDQMTPDALRDEDLHFLKGSALNLGFAALAEYCRSGDGPDKVSRRSASLPGLRATFARSKDEFLAGVSRYLPVDLQEDDPPEADPQGQEVLRSGIPPMFHLP